MRGFFTESQDQVRTRGIQKFLKLADIIYEDLKNFHIPCSAADQDRRALLPRVVHHRPGRRHPLRPPPLRVGHR